MTRNLTRLLACASLLIPTPAAAQLASSVRAPTAMLDTQRSPAMRRSMVLRYAIPATPLPVHQRVGDTYTHVVRRVVDVTVKLVVLLMSTHHWLATGEPVVPGE